MIRFEEVPNSGRISDAMPGEERTWTQQFVYVNDEEANLDAHFVRQDVTTGVPFTGMRHPDKPIWVCRSVEVSPIPQSKFGYMISVRWSTRHVLDNPAEATASTRQWFRITRSTSIRTVAQYRSGTAIWSAANLLANKNVTWPPTADIGGDKVDANGQPKQLRVAQQTIDVSFLWDRTYDSTNAIADGADPEQQTFDAFLNTRNNASFLGWQAGMVTYVGTTYNQAPDEWMVVTHKFIADEWYHLEQRAVPNIAGPPLLVAGTNWIGMPMRQAEKVAWYQPFNSVVDFELLFSWRDGLWESITTPQPAWPP